MRKINHQEFKMYAPAGVPDILYKYCKQNPIYVHYQRDFFKHLFIVHHITTHSFYQKTENENYPINIKFLSSMLGTKDGETISIIKNLVRLAIIYKVSSHQNRIKSASYSLTTKAPVWESVIALQKYTSIPSKIITRRNAQRRKLGNNLKIYRKYISNITLDMPADYFSAGQASEKVEKKFISTYSTASTSFSSTTYSSPSYSYISSSTRILPLMLGDFSCNSTPVSNTDDFTKLFFTTEKVNPNFLSIEAIQRGNWFLHRPDKRSRVHTNLTNLKRECREFLRYNGKPLVELDIRNSQPLVASILIKDYFLKQSKSLPEDVIQYQKDCEAGTFYDYFMHLNRVPTESRSDFKAQMFGDVFFSKVSNRKTELKTQFISKYPGAYEAICAIKGGLGSKTYNRLAILLQQKEASIIFDNVNMGLLKEGIPAFNIFDSILCLQEHKELARERLLSAFAALNITPTINYK